MTIQLQHRTAHDGRDDDTPPNVVPIGGWELVAVDSVRTGER